MKKDRFVRTEDGEGIYANSSDESGMSVLVPKIDGIKSQIFFRRIIKQNDPDSCKTILVAEFNGVFLYITEGNELILTNNGELR